MSQFMQSRPIRRAPRVNLRGSLSCTLQLENGRRLIARMHQLSITGGLLEVPAYVEERTWVGLTIALGDSLLYPTVEMLFPMRGGVGFLQPFRIARMRETERHQLDRVYPSAFHFRFSSLSTSRYRTAHPICQRVLLEWARAVFALDCASFWTPSNLGAILKLITHSPQFASKGIGRNATLHRNANA